MRPPMTASATSGAGTPASESRLLDAARTALSTIAGDGFEVGAGWGAWPEAGAAGVVPGGTPVVAVGPADEPPVGVVAAGGAAALFEHPPAARFWIASSSAFGKSGAYCSMSLGTWRLASASCSAEYVQGLTLPVFLYVAKMSLNAFACAAGATASTASRTTMSVPVRFMT